MTVPPQVINNHKWPTQMSTGAHRTKKKNPPSTGHSAELPEKRTVLRYLASAPSYHISSFSLSCLCVPQMSLRDKYPTGQFSISPALYTPHQLSLSRPLANAFISCLPVPHGRTAMPQLSVYGFGHRTLGTHHNSSSASFP